jgi:hypothetical protein
MFFDSKQTGFGRESRFQRWRFLAMTPGAVPQAASERRPLALERIRAATCRRFQSADMSAHSKDRQLRMKFDNLPATNEN